MAQIDTAMVIRLQAALRGESTAEVAESDQDRFNQGAVWFGDWYHNQAGRFGSEAKPCHNAAISGIPLDRPGFTLAPITTIKRGRDAILLPRGTIPGGLKFENAYLLPRFRLVASRKTLEKFEYRCTLPQDIVQAMRIMLNRRNRS